VDQKKNATADLENYKYVKEEIENTLADQSIPVAMRASLEEELYNITF
jgi:hypothetical protein